MGAALSTHTPKLEGVEAEGPKSAAELQEPAASSIIQPPNLNPHRPDEEPEGEAAPSWLEMFRQG